MSTPGLNGAVGFGRTPLTSHHPMQLGVVSRHQSLKASKEIEECLPKLVSQFLWIFYMN